MIIDLDEVEFIEHFGVKGQKWGVRRDRRANRLLKVGRGEGNLPEKLRSLGEVNAVNLVRGRGLKGAARIRGERAINRNARVRAGEASVRDKIAFYGGSRYQDVFPTGKPSTNTKAAVGASIAGAIIVVNGLAIAGRLLAPK